MAVPILQSLLLADHVYRDQATGKHIICGVFSTIFFTPNTHLNFSSQESGPVTGGGSGGGHPFDRGPGGSGEGGEGDSSSRVQPIQQLMQAGSPYVYFSLTELSERKTFEVRYVELRENRSLFQAEVAIECDDPLKTIEVSLPLPRLPLVALEERAYALEVLCEGQLLGSHRVLARMTPGSAPPGL
ncbi:hypothetical protein [Schlesneria sp.]|uniref:hypothetical protein n=1 Tax=Schlesneria sp. TaxID=2762018 RepID=UPI002F04BD84